MRLELSSPRKPTNFLFVIALAFLGILLLKLWFGFRYGQFVDWDCYAYLDNAKVFLLGLAPNRYFELLRPPLLSYLISLGWTLTGQSIAFASTIQPIFTIATAILIYKMGADMFNARVGTFSALTFLLTPLVFVFTNQILTHGVMDFFATAAVYYLWKATSVDKPQLYLPAGMFLGFAGLARYTGLLLVPISLVFVVSVVIVRLVQKKRTMTSREIGWLSGGVAAFLAVWSPWFVWNYLNANGNPIASVIAGVGTSANACTTSCIGDPAFYVLNVYQLFDSHFLLIPAGILLALGIGGAILRPKKLILDQRALLVGIWILVFFVFYAVIPNKDVRFYVDWFMPLTLILGFGFDRTLSFFKRYPILQKLIVILAVVWLLGLSYVAIQDSNHDINTTAIKFDPVGLSQTLSWARSNMNTANLGASDLPTMLSYFTNRNFLGIEPGSGLPSVYLYAPESTGIPVGDYLAHADVKYVIVTTKFAQSNDLDSNSSALRLITTLGVFRIYVTTLSN